MRAHSKLLDDKLLSAERRIQAINNRLHAFISDQRSLSSSPTPSSPLLSITPSSAPPLPRSHPLETSHDLYAQVFEPNSSQLLTPKALRRRLRYNSPSSHRQSPLTSPKSQTIKPSLQCSAVSSSSILNSASSSAFQKSTRPPTSPLQKALSPKSPHHYLPSHVPQSIPPQFSHKSQAQLLACPKLSTSASSSPRSQTSSVSSTPEPEAVTIKPFLESSTHSFTPSSPPPAPPLPPSFRKRSFPSDQVTTPPASPVPTSTSLILSLPLPPPPPPPPLPNIIHPVSAVRQFPPPPPPPIPAPSKPEQQLSNTNNISQTRIEKKLDALHVALTTALSLLQSQPAVAYATSDMPLDISRLPKNPPSAEHTAQVFDSRNAMLEELKERIEHRQKSAELGAIANY